MCQGNGPSLGGYDGVTALLPPLRDILIDETAVEGGGRLKTLIFDGALNNHLVEAAVARWINDDDGEIIERLFALTRVPRSLSAPALKGVIERQICCCGTLLFSDQGANIRHPEQRG